jgi:hypothetical protein
MCGAVEQTHMSRSATPISFAGARLADTRHVCAFFNSEEEEYRVLLPFIRDGFDCGHRAIHVVNPEREERHIGRLASLGIDLTDARRRGQLQLRTSTEAYLDQGHFDQDRLLQMFESIAKDSLNSPYQLSRIICQMDWASGSPSCFRDLIEFEARVNDVWSRHDDAVICVYDLAKFSGDVVIDIMRTHPMIIVGGVLQHNPFFMPPRDFLRELEQRRLDQAPSRQDIG